MSDKQREQKTFRDLAWDEKLCVGVWRDPMLRGYGMAISFEPKPMCRGDLWYARQLVSDRYTDEDEGRDLDAEHRGFCLNRETLETLMTDLWNLGIRPKGVEYGNEGLQMARERIEDLKTVAWHALKIGKERK